MLFMSSLCYGTSSVLQGRAAQADNSSSRINPTLVLSLIRRNLTYIIALLLNAAGAAAQLPALRLFPLVFVQTEQILNLAITALIGSAVLKFKLHSRDWLAIIALAVGLLFAAISITVQHSPKTGIGFRLGLLALTLLVACAGIAACRLSSDSYAALTLSCIAGLAFGTAGAAFKSIPSLAPIHLIQDPASYAILGSLYIAFWFYAAGMKRGSVTATTAGVLVVQIGASTIIGTFILGDHLKSGHSLSAALGVLISLSALFFLARFGSVTKNPEVA